jgi:hypothetical protein
MDTSAETLADVKALLSASPWFDSVEAERDAASLLVSVEPIVPTPYHNSPAHSPGMVLVVLVLPVPWDVNRGYRLTAVVPESGASAEIDTRREVRAISWSLAPIVNLVNTDRAFRPGSERELAQIHAQLLPLVESLAHDAHGGRATQ